MSSEYLTWLARNEKPEEKRELTPKEKRANWWHYHKWHVVIALVAVLAVCLVIRDIRNNIKTEPNLQIGYVGSYYLPEDTITALEENLAPLIGDLDGNGTTIVHINQYLLIPEDADPIYRDPNQQMVLSTHLATGVNSMFLLEDPVAFQEQYGVLAQSDGSEPPEGSSDGLWYRWADCEALSSLSLGTFEEQTVTGDSQEVLAELYFARSFLGNDPDPEAEQRYNTVWNQLISDTNP